MKNERSESDTYNRSARGKKGMVAAAREEASKAGVQVLSKGGNAFDAAVATAFALGVCEPQASGIGGGGFMTAHLARENRDIFVDFREVAPNSANPDMWKIDGNGCVINNEKGEGGKSVCVPGEVAGLCYILENYGTMSLETVMEPAIKMAENGYIVTEALERDLKENFERMKKYAEPGNVYLNDYKAGDRLVNIPLANTLIRISKEGKKAFYDSDLTDQMIKSLNSFGGAFTREDFSSFEVKEKEPVHGTYRGYDVISSPTPSSGGTHVIEILNILENFPVNEMEYHSAEQIHLFSEVFKMVFADRAKYMGDPEYVKVPQKGLISKEYAKTRAKEYQADKVLQAAEGNPFMYESADTTHFSVADDQGNIVSITKTLSSFFGSAVVPENTGLVLNCQMRGFSLGKGKSNSVCGGKKPLSSMSPTIILKEGKPVAALGTPGANRIITTMAQVITNIIDYHMGLQEAINSPRFYNDVPNVFHYESRIDVDSIRRIAEIGQNTKERQSWDRFMGGVQGIVYDDDGLVGAADPRRDGIAVGY